MSAKLGTLEVLLDSLERNKNRTENRQTLAQTSLGTGHFETPVQTSYESDSLSESDDGGLVFSTQTVSDQNHIGSNLLYEQDSLDECLTSSEFETETRSETGSETESETGSLTFSSPPVITSTSETTSENKPPGSTNGSVRFRPTSNRPNSAKRLTDGIRGNSLITPIREEETRDNGNYN